MKSVVVYKLVQTRQHMLTCFKEHFQRVGPIKNKPLNECSMSLMGEQVNVLQTTACREGGSFDSWTPIHPKDKAINKYQFRTTK